MLKCVSLEKKTVKEYSYGEKYKFILKKNFCLSKVFYIDIFLKV